MSFLICCCKNITQHKNCLCSCEGRLLRMKSCLWNPNSKQVRWNTKQHKHNEVILPESKQFMDFENVSNCKRLLFCPCRVKEKRSQALLQMLFLYHKHLIASLSPVLGPPATAANPQLLWVLCFCFCCTDLLCGTLFHALRCHCVPV